LKSLYVEFCGDTSCIILSRDSAICLTKNQMFHERTKHIDIKYHYIRKIVFSRTRRRSAYHFINRRRIRELKERGTHTPHAPPPHSTAPRTRNKNDHKPPNTLEHYKSSAPLHMSRKQSQPLGTSHVPTPKLIPNHDQSQREARALLVEHTIISMFPNNPSSKN
jgi:hypothetical protein